MDMDVQSCPVSDQKREARRRRAGDLAAAGTQAAGDLLIRININVSSDGMENQSRAREEQGCVNWEKDGQDRTGQDTGHPTGTGEASEGQH